MRGERIAAPLLALLVVFSGAGGAIAPGASPVGTAEAQLGDGSGGACTSTDWFLTFVSGTIFTTNCKTAGDVSEEWNETDAKETRTQIHSQAGQLSAGNEQFLTALDNSLLESDTIAFSKGEAAAVEVLANGGTVSEAQQAANETIDDYYTIKERNVIDRREVAVQTVLTLNSRAENTTGVSSDFVTFGGKNDFGDNWEDNQGEVDTNVSGLTYTKTYQTVNGTSVQITAPGIAYDDAFSAEDRNLSVGLTQIYTEGNVETAGDWAIASNLEDHQTNISTVKVRPTDSLGSKTAIEFREFESTSKEIRDQSQATKEEVAVYVEQSLGPAVQNGELDAQSYVSPATLAQEYAQEYNGSESYIRATAIASMSGMSTPSLEGTGSMTVVHDGKSYTGLLLSQEGPQNDTWESGQQYDPALLSGMQLFAVAGENSSVIELDGPFTITSISGTDGEEIETASTEEVTYQTSNASANYTQLQQQIRSLQEQIEERQAEATTGGSDTTTNNDLLAKIAAALGVSTGVVLLVAAAAVVLIAKVYLPDS